MAREKLPLSVLVALGLSSCGTCRPGVCLSIARDDEGGEELRPCLSVLPPTDPPPDAPPDAPPDVCLSIAPPPEGLPPEPPTHPCLSPPIPELGDPPEPEAVPDDPPRPCLSMRWDPPPPPEPDPETLQICLSEDLDPEELDDGGAALEIPPGQERLALLERLGDALPVDVRERL